MQEKSGNKLSVCYIVGKGEAEWLQLSIESVDYLADEFVFILDEHVDYDTKIMLRELSDERYKIINHRWITVGDQMNQFFKYATGDWILQLDCDEILGDTGYLLRDYMEGEHDCYDLRMVHFVYNFGLVDATKPEHFVLRRFYKKTDSLSYPSTEHAVLQGVRNPGIIKDVTIYHFCHAKRMMRHVKTYEKNLERSRIHTKEFLDWWYKSILLNKYPVKPYDGDYPAPIKRRFYL